MRYRRLGRTELDVSILSLEASPMGLAYRSAEQDEAFRCVRLALDGGINVIDVSPVLGEGRSEALLGEALRGVPREQYLLAGKCGRLGPGPGQCDYSAAGVQRSIDASLDRLGTDHFDLLQAHDIECGDEEQILGETLPALARAREQGKARFVGVTALPLGPIERAAASDLVDTVMSYAHYTLQNTGLVRLLPGLKEKDLGVIAAAPLGMGLLSSAGPADRHPAPERVRQYCARAAGRAEKYGIPISKLAIQYATARPEIHTTLLATASPDQLRRHLKWIDEPINEELLAQIQDVLAPVHNVTWAHGRTENNPPEVLGAEARSQRLGPGA